MNDLIAYYADEDRQFFRLFNRQSLDIVFLNKILTIFIFNSHRFMLV
jgi:hypothetical protein